MSNAAREAKKSGKGMFAFGPANWALLLTSVVVVVIGYVLLDGGSVTAAPVLLILGYAVLMPAGILLGWRRIGDAEED